jgi:putative transposase
MWSSKQGDLEIVYEAGRWQAHMLVRVGVKPPKSNPKGYVEGSRIMMRGGKTVKRNPESIRQRNPIGDEEAFIDVSLNNLFVVVITDGSAMLIKGGVIKSEHFYWKNEKAVLQSIRDRLMGLDLKTWVEYHRQLLKANAKARRRLKHLYRSAIRFLADELYNRGVLKIYMGYLCMISQDNGNKYNTNIWWFRKIARWLGETLEEYGIELYLQPENYTSIECSICSARHGNGRIYRGLYECEKTRKKINADLNAASNMAKKMGHEIEIRRIESYIATHSGVKPITPQRGNGRDPSK